MSAWLVVSVSIGRNYFTHGSGASAQTGSPLQYGRPLLKTSRCRAEGGKVICGMKTAVRTGVL
jgi:hypothetical protein